jgi:diacylglycerol kinase (ATP)
MSSRAGRWKSSHSGFTGSIEDPPGYLAAADTTLLMRRSTILVNPAARGGRTLRRLERLRLPAGVDMIRCGSRDELILRSRQAVDEDRRRLIVAGGDGTVHAAIQSVAGTDVILGIVPSGTGNDLAHALGLETASDRALEQALDSNPRTIDLGRVGERVFAGVAGVGIDASVLEWLNRTRTRIPAKLRYPWAALRCIGQFAPPQVELELDAETISGTVSLVALANTPRYGGGMRIAPQARLDDGQLDLVWVEGLSSLQMTLLFPRVYIGSHISHPAVRHEQLRSAMLRGPSDLWLHADGELVCRLGDRGVRIEVWPGALQVAGGSLV